jgi:hypothetical protein
LSGDDNDNDNREPRAASEQNRGLTIMTTLPTITLREVCADIDGFEKFEGRSDSEHFQRGAEIAKGLDYMTIGVNNVWSYERIGYHAGSISFAVGAFSTGCPIFVYRSEDTGLVKYELVAANP